MAERTSDPRFVQWLEAIETDGVNLTGFEEVFITSMREAIERYGSLKLTEPQAKTLERIYTERVP